MMKEKELKKQAKNEERYQRNQAKMTQSTQDYELFCHNYNEQFIDIQNSKYLYLNSVFLQLVNTNLDISEMGQMVYSKFKNIEKEFDEQSQKYKFMQDQLKYKRQEDYMNRSQQINQIYNQKVSFDLNHQVERHPKIELQTLTLNTVENSNQKE